MDAAIVGKWIPYFHTSALPRPSAKVYTPFKGDPEDERRREQHAARERALQQMEDFARELAEGLDHSMMAIVRKRIDDVFDNVNGQLERMRGGFSGAE